MIDWDPWIKKRVNYLIYMEGKEEGVDDRHLLYFIILRGNCFSMMITELSWAATTYIPPFYSIILYKQKVDKIKSFWFVLLSCFPYSLSYYSFSLNLPVSLTLFIYSSLSLYLSLSLSFSLSFYLSIYLSLSIWYKYSFSAFHNLFT